MQFEPLSVVPQQALELRHRLKGRAVKKRRLAAPAMAHALCIHAATVRQHLRACLIAAKLKPVKTLGIAVVLMLT